jgi:Ni,Fe-hydrogenase III small subunit
LAQQFGAGGYVGRASGRAFDARRVLTYAPYDNLSFEVPVLDAGDVNARVWIRIREIEQSLSLIEQILAVAPSGEIKATIGKTKSCEGLGVAEAFRGDVLVWLKLDGRGPCCSLPPAGRLLVPVALTGSSDRGQYRRRLSALQQIVQLLLFGTRHLAMRKTLFESLTRGPLTEPAPAPDEAALAELAKSVNRAARAKLGRSLSIRQVDAGSCNGCELEIHALNNAFYDLERFGLRFVASPRHADVLMVTGPVTKNMREALMRTYNATPDPKWVVAVGSCAADAGIFADSYAVTGGVKDVIPVDLHIHGCPPSPVKLLSGLLALLEDASGMTVNR